MRDATCLAALGALALIAGSATAGIGGDGDRFKIADSFEDYHGNQGENGWFYGYYNGNVQAAYTPADFELMTNWDSGNNRWWVDNTPGGPLTLIDSVFMHPWAYASEAQGNDHWAVRRWVSNVNGPVEIDISMLRGSPEVLGDGVRLHVFVNGVKRLIADLNQTNTSGLQLKLFENVAAGSVIDFAIDPVGNPFFDGTRFNAIITTTVPSPASLALLGLGTLVAVRRRR